MLKAALALAESGAHIFPCHYPIFASEMPSCSCGNPKCKSKGKHPAIKGWRTAATRDPQEIVTYWRKHPDYNIGLPTGAINNFDILDEDPKNGGEESLEELIEEYGPLPDTITTKTGSGGKHFYFQHSPGLKNNNTGKIKSGIDFKTNGGYVIAPPSMHISGIRYQWITPIPELSPPPSWLASILLEQFAVTTNYTAKPVDDWDRVAKGAYEKERHDTLLSLAGHLLTRLKSKDLAMTLVHCYNKSACFPPKSEDEVNGILKYIINQHARKNANK